MPDLGGLHHLTAITGRARQNLDFYTTVLGLRLVKKTVNQDVTSSYHLFYGDEVGNPGTEMTFFDWPNVGANTSGTGEVAAVGFAVPDPSALEWWSKHFESLDVSCGQIEQRGDRKVLPFVDGEGQRLELIAGAVSNEVEPWTESPVPAEVAIRGLGAVTLVVDSLDVSAHFLEHALGFKRTGEYAFPDNPSRTAAIFETGAGGLGAEVHLEARPDLPPARQGIGGVHHVAFRVADEEQHIEWHDRLQRLGVGVTQVIDRYYFRSIYFREPGGVLYEIATDGPGFTGDEDPAHLGERSIAPAVPGAPAGGD